MRAEDKLYLTLGRCGKLAPGSWHRGGPAQSSWRMGKGGGDAPGVHVHAHVHWSAWERSLSSVFGCVGAWGDATGGAPGVRHVGAAARLASGWRVLQPAVRERTACVVCGQVGLAEPPARVFLYSDLACAKTSAVSPPHASLASGVA